ncbi:hypothetical protein IW150_006874, partial [Coemansia sp. RSA 2607]
MRLKLSASALLFVLPILTQVPSVSAWPTAAPVQKLFTQTTLDTVIVFIPEKNSPVAINPTQANTISKSVFSPDAYALSKRFSDYSSGAIKMTGLAGTNDSYVTVRYLTKGIDSCDRNTIVNGVKAAIAPANPARLIIVQNTRKPTCPGYADNNSLATMVWTLDALNPHVLFHELGHSLSFSYPATSLCYSKGVKVMMSSNCTS